MSITIMEEFEVPKTGRFETEVHWSYFDGSEKVYRWTEELPMPGHGPDDDEPRMEPCS